MEEFKPAPTLTIDNLEALKVISDPLRTQIIEILVSTPMTVGQIAEKLGLSPSKLYYHVNQLEQHNFIRVVDTTTHGNLIEKHYWVSALDFCINEQLLNFSTSEGKENINAMVTTVLDSTREDLLRSLQARAFNLEHGAEQHPRRIINVRSISRMSDERAEEFMHRLKELVQEFDDADEGETDGDTHPYALTVVAYPSFYYDKTSEEG